jgi:hypothetical protein
MEKTKQVNIRMPLRLVQWLLREAKDNGRRTMTNQVLYLIEKAMKGGT